MKPIKLLCVLYVKSENTCESRSGSARTIDAPSDQKQGVAAEHFGVTVLAFFLGNAFDSELAVFVTR
ncbi:hypothetical protein [Edaphobacter modestus]|uniref:hypothetical protein n=1 Tax=Edaphobacter modestus TaxID=388466 RepID=UPI00102CF7A4|nr:hypothetical protein [Edaphobacter modestus]